MSRLTRTTPIWTLAVLTVIGAGLTDAVDAAEFVGKFEGRPSYSLRGDESHLGDLYVMAPQTVDIAGTQQGDLAAWSNTVGITGTVEGDLFGFGNIVNIHGEVTDSARIFAGTVTVSGKVRGDLIVFGGNVTLTDGARIGGDLVLMGGQMSVAGEIEQRLRVGGGALDFDGIVHGDADIEVDKLVLGDNAHFNADLNYKTREEVEDLASRGIVAGELTFKPKEKKESKDEGFSLFWPAFWLVGTILTGCIAILAFRGFWRQTDEAIGRDGLPSVGIGFLVALVTPVAAIILLFLGLFTTFPLSLIILFLWLALIYLAKIPVAVWLGRLVLKRFGSGDPSPYLGLLIGAVLLYIVFAVPYLGALAYVVTLCLGLGAIFLALRSKMATPPTAPSS